MMTKHLVHFDTVFNTAGVRARAALLGMMYSKIMRLRSLKTKTVGEVIMS